MVSLNWKLGKQCGNVSSSLSFALTAASGKISHCAAGWQLWGATQGWLLSQGRGPDPWKLDGLNWKGDHLEVVSEAEIVGMRMEVQFPSPDLLYSASRREVVRRNSPGATFYGNCGKWAISGDGEKCQWPMSGLFAFLRADTWDLSAVVHLVRKSLSAVRHAGRQCHAHPLRWLACVLRVRVSFENGLHSVKLCLSTAATQPLGFLCPSRIM